MKTVMMVTVDWEPEYDAECSVPIISSKLKEALLNELKSELGNAVESWRESCVIDVENDGTFDDERDEIPLYVEVNDYDVKNILELKMDKK